MRCVSCCIFFCWFFVWTIVEVLSVTTAPWPQLKRVAIGKGRRCKTWKPPAQEFVETCDGRWPLSLPSSKLTWLAGTPPFPIGNTSTRMVDFPAGYDSLLEGNIFSDFKTRIVVSWRTLDLWEGLQEDLMPSEAGRILKFSRVFLFEEGECRWLHRISKLEMFIGSPRKQLSPYSLLKCWYYRLW